MRRRARHPLQQQLIGAQFFNAGDDFVIDEAGLGWTRAADEYLDSPRDSQGRGSHASSTAGGNRGPVGVVSNGVVIGQISGVAPRARISSCQACWSDIDSTGARKNSCFTGDTTAAIDKATADGVDVISYSIGGTLDDLLDPVEVAFFNATAAVVFVAAAADDARAEGALTWTDRTHVVRSPMGLRGRLLGAPVQFNHTTGTGGVHCPVSCGFTGRTGTGSGGAAACQAGGPGTVSSNVVTTSRTILARFATHDADQDSVAGLPDTVAIGLVAQDARRLPLQRIGEAVAEKRAPATRLSGGRRAGQRIASGAVAPVAAFTSIAVCFPSDVDETSLT